MSIFGFKEDKDYRDYGLYNDGYTKAIFHAIEIVDNSNGPDGLLEDIKEKLYECLINIGYSEARIQELLRK